jgi:hypothetical protein
LPLWGAATLYERIPEEKKPRSLRGKTFSKSFWLKLSIIICVLIFVPSEIHFREEYRAVVPYYYFSISSVFMFYSRWEDIGGFEISSIESHFMVPITLISAIVIALPAIYLNRKLRDRPADAPILNLSLGALFATILLTFWFVEYFPPSEFIWIFQSFPSWGLMNFGTLIITFLILLPLFSRETFLWGEERVSERRKAFGTRISWQTKYSLLGYSWGLATLLIPLVANIQLFDSGAFSSRFESPSYVLRLDGASIPPWNSNNWIIASLDVYHVFDFVSFLVVSVFHIVFAFHVLRYLRGMTSQKRVIQLGILSMLAPLMYHTIIAANPIPEPVFASPIPIPIVLIIGIATTVMIKPDEKRIRAEDFGEDEIAYPDIPDDDASIQVPLLYYIKSKLRDILRRNSRSEAD